MTPTIRNYPTADYCEYEKHMREVGMIRERERLHEMERERLREMEREMQKQMDLRAESLQQYHYERNRVLEEMENRIGTSIREEVDADILRRMVEISETQPLDNNLISNFFEPPSDNIEEDKDNRSDDDKYLERLGV